jgi:hypothetical protein
MAGHRFDPAAVKFVQCAVVADQTAFCQINMIPNFRPESFNSRKQTVQLPGKCVMRRAGCFIRLNPLRFRAAINFLCTDQKIYVIIFCYFRFIHAGILTNFSQLRNPYRYFKKLVNTDDIWEVRVSAGRNIFRLLDLIREQEVIILTNSFYAKALGKNLRLEVA